MTPHDFICWLAGFAAGVGGAPTDEQWAQVREALGRVQRAPAAAPTPVLPLPKLPLFGGFTPDPRYAL